MESPQLGLYRHYKGKEYILRAVGKLKANSNEVAIYQGPDGAWWVRPLKEFTGLVEVNGEYVPRFLFLDGEKKL